MDNTSCGACHNCGHELNKGKDSKETCPNCGKVMDSRSHQNLGVTSCQFANFMRQQEMIGNMLFAIASELGYSPLASPDSDPPEEVAQ